jgi:PGF-CTERM protein
MRKALTALALAAAFAVFVGPAVAQAQDYPPSGEDLTVSDSRVVRGQSITISGGGAEPGATVQIIIAGQVVATTTADGDGNFSASFSIPAGLEVGTYTVTAVSNGEVLSSLQVAVATGSSSGSSSDLPFTGSTTLPGIGIGVGLIALGSALLMLSRRRRSQREHETVG